MPPVNSACRRALRRKSIRTPRPFTRMCLEPKLSSNRVMAVAAGVAAVIWFCALASPQTRRPHFTDVAPRSKFSYISNNDLSPRKYFVQPMCGGIAILDFDNDGKMDIFFSNGAKLPELKKTGPSFYNCLLRNRGDGTFEDVTRKAGLIGENLDYNFCAAVGDFDNDG